jgi:16S rRNA processing protein RimM
VQSYTRPRGNLLSYRRWWIGGEAGYQAEVVEIREHGNGLVAQITDPEGKVMEDREAAQRLVGTDIEVDRADMPAPPPGTCYWADLIGLAVESSSGQRLGIVESLMETGAQDVLVVRDGEVERLIPFVRGPIIRKVDLGSRRIEAEWEPDY